MQMDPRLNCEYERAYPRTQPYSRLPYDKRAEKAWWRIITAGIPHC